MSSSTTQQVFNVNGVMRAPLPPGDRAHQIDVIESTRRRSIARIAALDLNNEDDVAAELARCMHPTTGFEYWCQTYAYTFDPRTSPAQTLFILYEFQRVAARIIINAIRNGGNLLIEKSRDMGASWIMMAAVTWCWIFDDSFHALVGSRKEDLVDDRGPDSLLGKVDYILDRLPPWMLPGYVPQKHRRALRLENPRTGNLITGESANPGFGRGPRKNLVLFDEFAFTENDNLIWTGIQDTAPCRVVVSTPNGETNKFAQLRFSGQIPVLTFHWTEHPKKDTHWYEQEKLKRTPREIAQELDIDYKASGGRLAFPCLQKEEYRTRIICPPLSPQDSSNAGCTFYGALDWGTNNPSSYSVNRVRRLDPHNPRLIEVTTCFHFYQPANLELVANIIKNNPWAPYVKQVFADPSMWFFNQNSKDGVSSLAYLLRDLYQVHISPGVRGDQMCVAQINDMWKSPQDVRYYITEDCPMAIWEMENLHYIIRTARMQSTRNEPEILADKDNHFFDSLTYFLNSYMQLYAAAPLEPAAPQLIGYAAFNAEKAQLRSNKLKKLAQERTQYSRPRFA